MFIKKYNDSVEDFTNTLSTYKIIFAYTNILNFNIFLIFLFFLVDS